MIKYAEYKDSGIEWIGQIPTSWNITKLRYLCRIKTGNKDTANSIPDGQYPFYVRSPNIERIDSFSFDGEAILTAGDGVGAGKVFHYAKGKFDYHQRVYNLHHFSDVYGKFLFYYMSENFHNEIERGNAKSTVDSIRLPMLQDFPISMPKIGTQVAVVSYLDRKTAKINNIIADKEKLIELLKEKRRAIISEAVTRGLNPSVQTKDSGIDWIGEVPAHWEIKPLFTVAFENKAKNSGNQCTNLLSLSYGKIIKKDIDTNFGLLPESFETYQIVEDGYTILRLTDLQNDKRSLRSGFVSEKGIITSAYVGLIPADDVDGLFLSDLLHAYDLMKIFYSLGNGVRQSMNYKDLKRLPILLPPKSEQKLISNYLRNKTAEIDDLISTAEQQVSLFKEYRQSIISEAVTGKVAIS